MTIELNEAQRLEALKGYCVLDTAPEEAYDNLTRLASEICGTPISLITLIDERRQWFKSAVGLKATETPREHSFCAHAIQKPAEALIVPDSREDERFANNPYVTGEPHIVFYAGIPLVDERGHALGSLCVLHRERHTLSAFQIGALQVLAKQVVALMQFKRKNEILLKLVNELEQKNGEPKHRQNR